MFYDVSDIDDEFLTSLYKTIGSSSCSTDGSERYDDDDLQCTEREEDGKLLRDRYGEGLISNLICFAAKVQEISQGRLQQR